MKKLIILAAIMLTAGTFTVKADNDRIIKFEELPAAARQFTKKYFPNESVAYSKVERDFLEVQYEVMFSNGSKVEFLKNGEWKDVDCKYNSVPAELVPAQIAAYVDKNYKGASIVQIDRDTRDYEVKLSNGLELTFDLRFNLIDIDD